MIGPSYNLQRAVYQALKAADIGTDNIFHTVPKGTSLPWVVIGDDQIVSDNEAGTFFECFVTVHVHGKKPVFKAISDNVQNALTTHIYVEDFSTDEAWFDDLKFISESDPSIGHAVLMFRYLLQPLNGTSAPTPIPGEEDWGDW